MWNRVLLHDSRKEMTLRSGSEYGYIVAGMHALILGYIAREDKIIGADFRRHIHALAIRINVVLGADSIVECAVPNAIDICVVLVQSENGCASARIASYGQGMSVIRCDDDQGILNARHIAGQLNGLLELQCLVQGIACLCVVIAVVNQST